jgi:hypothetical protein
VPGASGRRSPTSRSRLPDEREQSDERDLIVALDAALSEERERTAQLESRLERIEEYLGVEAPFDAVPPSAPGETEARVEAPRVSIDTWHWDEAEEETYWLRRCEGFRVNDSSGALGVVDSVRFGRDLDRPETLLVVARRHGRRRRFEVAVSELAAISPEQREITLAVPARDWLLPAPSPWRFLTGPRSRARIARGP